MRRRGLLAFAALIALGACGNEAAERKAAAQGQIAVEAHAPPAPADQGLGDNTGSILTPGAAADPPTSQPDQTGATDQPVTQN